MYEVNVLCYQNAAANIAFGASSRLLSMFWVCESNVASGKTQYEGVLKGEISRLLDNLDRLLELNAVDRKKTEVEEDMAALSKIVFDPDNEDTIRALADRKQIDLIWLLASSLSPLIQSSTSVVGC